MTIKVKIGQCDLKLIEMIKDVQEIFKVDSLDIMTLKDLAVRVVGLATTEATLWAKDVYNAKHVVVVFERTLFEYDMDGYHIREYNPDEDDDFYDWNALKALNGMTNKTTQDIIDAVENDPQWKKGNYNLFTHNCHDFVQFCLKAAKFPSSMIIKKGPVYRPQK